MRHAEEYFICFMLTCVSFPSACDCVIGAGLVLTGSWWGVMRDANTTILAWRQINWWPVNLFRGFCPCICLTLKLLSSISGFLYVTVCSFLPPPQFALEKAETRACVSPSVVRSHQIVFLCVHKRLEERKLEKRVPIYTSFGGFKVILSCFANQQSSGSQSKRCLIQQ